MDEEPAPPAPRSRSLLDAWREHRFHGAAVGYLVAAWTVLQVAAIVLPGFGAPAWALRARMILLALGPGATLLIVWSRDRRARGLPLVPRTPHTRLAWTLTAILPAALVTTFFLLRPLPRPAAASNPKAPAAPSAPEKSIAILPFDNLSDDKANGFFTDGMQDEILTDLAKLADLRVVSRSSVMQYRGNTARNLPEIAAQLGVAHIVEGSVQRAGNEVRVNAQLIDARTNAHEWAMNYDKTLYNVFTVQTEVAQAIAEQLRARISPEEHAAMTAVPTRDALAPQLYQQAKELDLREADTDSREGLILAVSL